MHTLCHTAVQCITVRQSSSEVFFVPLLVTGGRPRKVSPWLVAWTSLFRARKWLWLEWLGRSTMVGGSVGTFAVDDFAACELTDSRVGTVLKMVFTFCLTLRVLQLSKAQHTALRGAVNTQFHHDAEHASVGITGEEETPTISARLDRCSGLGLTLRSGVHGLECTVEVASMAPLLAAVGCWVVLVLCGFTDGWTRRGVGSWWSRRGAVGGFTVAGPDVVPWLVGQDVGLFGWKCHLYARA